MTCEIAVMNLWGLALAADSAVTLGGGNKVYNSAEKLFQVGTATPIGIMSFGDATYSGVPWEVILADYSRQLDGRRFDSVSQCVEDLIEYLRRTPFLAVSPQRQAELFKADVARLWNTLYVEPLAEIVQSSAPPDDGTGNDMPEITTGTDTEGSQVLTFQSPDRPEPPAREHSAERDPSAILLDLIRKDHTLWEEHPLWEGADATWAQGLVEANASVLDELESELFPSPDLIDEEIRTALRQSVCLLLTRAGSCTPGVGNIVIGGLGETEPFPTLVQLQVAPMLGDRVRACRLKEWTVSQEQDALIVPFGQSEAIDSVINGIHPTLQDKLTELMQECWPEADVPQEEDSPLRRFEKALTEQIHDLCNDPFMIAVGALPRGDLASLADALVSLQIFLARHSANTQETVQGPVDVAVLSKGDGFQWVKRKNLGRVSELASLCMGN